MKIWSTSLIIQFSSVQSLSCVQLFATPWIAARPPCPSPSPGVHSNSYPLNQWCHPAISYSVLPFSSCLQSLPASESFPISQLFSWGGQSTGVSALAAAAATAKSLQSCPTLRQPTRLPVAGVLQAKTLEWVAISFSNAWKWKVKVKSLSRVRLFETPWTAPYQAPLPMGFSRQEYWSGVPLPSPQL